VVRVLVDPLLVRVGEQLGEALLRLFGGVRSERLLPGLSMTTLSVRMIRSPVMGSLPADTRTCQRSRAAARCSR
jgi:hypothetical protein